MVSPRSRSNSSPSPQFPPSPSKCDCLAFLMNPSAIRESPGYGCPASVPGLRSRLLPLQFLRKLVEVHSHGGQCLPYADVALGRGELPKMGRSLPKPLRAHHAAETQINLIC